MNHRLRQEDLTPTPNYGLVGWLEESRVTLPLKGVECRFRVCGDLLGVELDQIFHVNAPSALDCLYSFPLPSGAAVYRCEMHVNRRVIRARVEEKQRARELATEHKAAGHRTGLVEVERDNLFTLSLGNVQPGDMVVIRLAYFETLARLADWTMLRIPFCPGVRYIPGKPLLRQLAGKGTADDTDQVPDASRISPPRIDALHPEVAYLSVQGVVENPLGLVKDISSASHPVMVVDDEEQFRVTLADRDAAPAADFSLRWTELPAPHLQSAALALRDGPDTYALVLMSAPAVTGPVTAAPQDFYFLVDRSGSMSGLKWDQAIKSFRAFLGHLRHGDRAWVSFFDVNWQDFSEMPMTREELAADRGLHELERLGTGGGTELLPALDHALTVIKQHSRGREAQLVLITDGQVGNEAAIVEHLRPHSKLRVHTFGIDLAVNDGLLNRLAAQHNGTACLLQPTDDIVGAVARLGSRLQRPVLTSLVADAGWEFPGSTVPDLHAEDRVSLSLRITASDAREVVLKGRYPDGREERFRFPLLERDEPALRLLWASRRIGRCLNQGDSVQAIALAKHYNLLCEGAAFIAWDEAEKVPVAKREVYQPSVHLRGTLYNKIKSYDIAHCFIEKRKDSQCLDEGDSHLFLGIAESVGGADGSWNKATEVQVLLSLWRTGFLEAYALRRLYGGDSVIKLLTQWVESDPSVARDRLNLLEELVELLEKTPDTGPEKTDVFRNWIDRTFADSRDLREQLLTALDDCLRVVEEIDKGVAARLADALVNPKVTP